MAPVNSPYCRFCYLHVIGFHGGSFALARTVSVDGCILIIVSVTSYHRVLSCRPLMQIL
jgi:hypothetical protein